MTMKRNSVVNTLLLHSIGREFESSHGVDGEPLLIILKNNKRGTIWFVHGLICLKVMHSNVPIKVAIEKASHLISSQRSICFPSESLSRSDVLQIKSVL